MTRQREMIRADSSQVQLHKASDFHTQPIAEQQNAARARKKMALA
jgi:hypothetical protein